MKVSTAWLQKYFADPLPETDVVVDALTFHSSEVEEVIGEGDQTVLDVKILPDRAPYALSHRGIAYELAASLAREINEDPLRTTLPEYPADSKEKSRITVSIQDPQKCLRYMAARVSGVQVGTSPQWLQTALQTLGQRSINNVVDATNYVMLNIGQPLHAFDAAQLMDANGGNSIAIRGARKDEKMITLTGEEHTLPEGTIVIVDAVAHSPIGIAGVKGGKAAGITEQTTDIIIESANFDGTSVRKASQVLKLWTDASLRFQNKISPELAAYGMRDVLALILQLAGGTLEGVIDEYPNPAPMRSPVTITLEQLNGILGTAYGIEEVTGALSLLQLEYVVEGEHVTVRPSFERKDIEIWQDLAEEVGRVLGYDGIEAAPLPTMSESPDQKKFAGIERIKDHLLELGFTEVSTQAFASTGDIQLANPLQQERPWLRASLAGNMEDVLARASNVAPRVLGPEPLIKLFELGTVFTKDGEYLSLALGYKQLAGKASAAILQEAVESLIETFPAAGIQRAPDTGTGVAQISLKDANFEQMGEGYVPVQIELGPYTPFSTYPFALRDIAVWTPDGTMETEVSLLIQEHAGDLLSRMDLFDRFDKSDDSGTRTSYAFRLVFQANDKTLSDADIDPVMTQVTEALNAKEGWQVR